LYYLIPRSSQIIKLNRGNPQVLSTQGIKKLFIILKGSKYQKSGGGLGLEKKISVFLGLIIMLIELNLLYTTLITPYMLIRELIPFLLKK
jgi:hypothetical protein